MVQRLGSLPPAWEILSEFLAPSFDGNLSYRCRHLRNDPVDEKSVCLSQPFKNRLLKL